MSAWNTEHLPLRKEKIFGDRIVTCRADRPKTINEMFLSALERAPEREALVAGGFRFTWAELDALISKVAAALAEKGLKHGDRACLLMGNRAELVVLFHAIIRLGAIVIPLSAKEQAPGIAYIATNCGARFLIYEEALSDRVPAAKDLPEGTSIIALDEPQGGEIFPNIRSDNSFPEVQKGEEEIVMILYTSGTTGNPKGAMLAEVNAIHSALIYEDVMGLKDGDRTVVAVPMSHVTGIAGAVVLMLRCAGTLIVMAEFDTTKFLELASEEKMTAVILVPAMYALILARNKLSDYDLSHWRVACYGGAPMPEAVIQQLLNEISDIQLLNLYGATETMSAQAILPPEFAFDRRDFVGLAVAGAEILIMDESGHEVDCGQLGEIWMRNATVTPGYWNNAEATAENLVSGYWRSGDIGFIDEDGFLKVLDRIKDMINRGGYKIFTAEVENVLMGHPAVLESAVVAKPCNILGERVHGFVTVKDGSIDAEELSQYCAERLAEYKCPESFTITETPLPRNANGKLLKKQMREILNG